LYNAIFLWIVLQEQREAEALHKRAFAGDHRMRRRPSRSSSISQHVACCSVTDYPVVTGKGAL